MPNGLNYALPPNGQEYFSWAAVETSGLDGACLNSSEILQSPFKPYFVWQYYGLTAQNCWALAICVYHQADDARKQQWSATALVMGVLPITLFLVVKWPQKGFIYVRDDLPAPLEVIVRALGLDPFDCVKESCRRHNCPKIGCRGHAHAKGCAFERSIRSSSLAKEILHGKPWTKARLQVSLGISALALVMAYGILAVVEVFSKRCALGCPYPVFVVSWYFVALIPGALHTYLLRFRSRLMRTETATTSGQLGHPEIVVSTGRLIEDASQSVRQRDPGGPRKTGNSCIELDTTTDRLTDDDYDELEKQHEDDRNWWPIQLVWTIYFITGTLIYTSIMIVTVPELVVWVVASCATSMASKVFAFFICMVYAKPTRE